MKHVSDFVKFDFDNWVRGKEFILKGIYDRKNKEGVIDGKNVQLVILKDDCKGYKLREDEGHFDLVGEKIYVGCDKVSALIGDKIDASGWSVNVSAKGLPDGKGFLTVYFNTDEIKKIK